MSTAEIDVMGDGQKIGVDLDWQLLNRLEAERQSAKDDQSWLRHMKEDGCFASPEDRAWFRENSHRRAYVRVFTESEIENGWLGLDESQHLVLVKRIRVSDRDEYFPPEAVLAAEAVGEIVVVREPFKVKDIDEDLVLYQRIEDIVGADVFDTALRVWLSTSEIPQVMLPDGRWRPSPGPYLTYWKLDRIVEELYPGSTQILSPLDSPLA